MRWIRVRRRCWLAFLVLALALPGLSLAKNEPLQASGDTALPLLLRDDFERKQPAGWDFTDASAWRIAVAGPAPNRVLELFRASKYEPPVRSPVNIALVQGVDASDLVLDVKVRSTTRDYGHRDLCFIFGHNDPSHFYYVHLGKQADEHANSIFLVNGKPRVSIAEKRTNGTPWTEGWHHVRIVHRPGDGTIQVFFDDMTSPVMTAHDRTFAHGRVGVGSFDDTGMFDEFELKGNRHQASSP